MYVLAGNSENVIKAVYNGPGWAENRPKKGVSLSLGP